VLLLQCVVPWNFLAPLWGVYTPIFGDTPNKPALSSAACTCMPVNAAASIEGLQVPHVRNASDDEKQAFTDMIDRAYKLWLTHPRRGINC